MDVYWLEQTEADLPHEENWLSANEAAVLSTMRFPKRRADWLLGRWAAKNAFAICFGCSTEVQALREIEIRAASSGAPEVFFRNQPSTATISLSHRAGIGACALAPSRSVLGCDVEIIEPHGDAFAADYFTLEEQALFSKTKMADRLRLVALFWSGKESALKALGQGLRLDTRSMIVSLPFRLQDSSVSARGTSHLSYLPPGSSSNKSSDWSRLEVRHGKGQVFNGWWSQAGSLLRTMVSAPPSDVPLLLVKQHCLV